MNEISGSSVVAERETTLEVQEREREKLLTLQQDITQLPNASSELSIRGKDEEEKATRKEKIENFLEGLSNTFLNFHPAINVNITEDNATERGKYAEYIQNPLRGNWVTKNMGFFQTILMMIEGYSASPLSNETKSLLENLQDEEQNLKAAYDGNVKEFIEILTRNTSGNEKTEELQKKSADTKAIVSNFALNSANLLLWSQKIGINRKNFNTDQGTMITIKDGKMIVAANYFINTEKNTVYIPDYLKRIRQFSETDQNKTQQPTSEFLEEYKNLTLSREQFSIDLKTGLAEKISSEPIVLEHNLSEDQQAEWQKISEIVNKNLPQAA